MTDRNTNIDINKLQSAIEADIKAAFPDLKTVEFYGDERNGTALPACLLELAEWEENNDEDPGTEQQSVMARFEARFIIKGVATKQSKKDIRKLAAAFSAWIRCRKWNNPDVPGKAIPVSPAQFLLAEPDSFSPTADQYEVWRVEWQQVLHLGETVWVPGPDPAPGFVRASFSPDIGADHENDYVQIYP